MIVMQQDLCVPRCDQLHPGFGAAVVSGNADLRMLTAQPHIMRSNKQVVADPAGFADHTRLHRRTYLDGIVGEAAFEGIDGMSALPHILVQPLQRLIRCRIQCRNHDQAIT
ncbi:hypothetical protein D3C75_857590 [compost metagenome]